MDRRLAAILAADVVGYARLIGQDEVGTLGRLKACEAEVIDPLVAKHKGRMVKRMGDGFLVEFASVVNAVDCAAAWQAATAGGDDLSFRIGINLGDVVVEGEDIYGDGVNIAARLEGLAQAGGVCLSEDAYRQVRGKLNLAFEDLGEQDLKNIAQPVRAYQLAPAGSAPLSADLAPGVGVSIELPDKPSIAVLPFDNLSGDPEQDYIGDGMAEEIITALSKVPDLFVIARNSTFVYRGRAVNLGVVGRELGVRHVLEGSVRKAGKRLRITAQLIEAESGDHLWAERYDRELEDIFAMQDEITQKVAIALQRELVYGEGHTNLQEGTHNFRAWELCIKGISHQLKFAPADNAEARRLLEEAVTLDPDYDGAWAMLGWAHFIAVRFGYALDPAASLARLTEIVERLLASDADHGEGLVLNAALLILNRDHPAAIRDCARAVTVKPNDSVALAFLALVYGLAGQPEKALPRIKHAFRLSPYYPAWFLGPLIDAHYQLGNLEEALGLARLYAERLSGVPTTHARLAGLLGATGRIEEGKAALERVYELAPDYSITSFLQAMRYADDALGEGLCAGLRALGLPE